MSKAKNRRKDNFGYFPTKSPGLMNRCFECGVETTGLHHVVPVVAGGTKQIPLCEEHHNLVHGSQTIQSELIKKGIAKAKASGKVFGAKRKVTEEVAKQILKLREEGNSYREVAESLGLSVGAVYYTLNSHKPREIAKLYTYEEFFQKTEVF